MKTNINNTTPINNTTKKIKNWSQYNKSLENRGNFTILLDIAYLNKIPHQTSKAGHPVEYADAVILFIAQLREFMHLPIRQSIGAAKFIIKLAGLDLKLPTRSTISRRLASLNIPTNLHYANNSSPIIFLPDSTGLKVTGEGEWKVRKHGADKRRKWVKMHLGVDYNTQAIVALSVTSAKGDDGRELPNLLATLPDDLPRVSEIIADGAYDCLALYQSAEGQGATLITPPKKNSEWHGSFKSNKLIDDPGWERRNNYLKTCWRDGWDEWKKQVGYHRRSLAETAMYRMKQAFGHNLKSRKIENQTAEIKIRVSLLNLFTGYGLPRYSA